MMTPRYRVGPWLAALRRAARSGPGEGLGGRVLLTGRPAAHRRLPRRPTRPQHLHSVVGGDGHRRAHGRADHHRDRGRRAALHQQPDRPRAHRRGRDGVRPARRAGGAGDPERALVRARGGGARRGGSREPREGRVPRHARPRAAQPARAPSATPSPSWSRAGRRGSPRAAREVIARQVAPPGPARRRPARRVAGDARQDRAGAPARWTWPSVARRAWPRWSAARGERRAPSRALDGEPVWVRRRLGADRADRRRTCSGTPLKYTPAGGEIRVTVRRDGGRRACSRCATRASASPPDLLARVFDLFVQGERTLAPAPPAASASASRWCGGSPSCTAARVEASSDGPGTREPASSCACPRSGATRRLRRAAAPARARGRRAGACSSSRTTTTPARCCARLLQLARPRVARGGGRASPASRAALDAPRPRSRSSTSACPASTATRWRAASARDAAGQRLRLVALTGYGLPEDRPRASRPASTSTS